MSRAITLDKIPVVDIPDPPAPKHEDVVLPKRSPGSRWVIYGNQWGGNSYSYGPAWLDFTLPVDGAVTVTSGGNGVQPGDVWVNGSNTSVASGNVNITWE